MVDSAVVALMCFSMVKLRIVNMVFVSWELMLI